MSYDKTNSGTLGKNQRKETDKHPDYTGQINIEGKDYWLSGWIKQNGSTGEKFFSLAVKPKEDRKPEPKREQKPVQQDDPFSDDIPF